MNRDQFLSKAWTRYPAAESGWLDVGTFLREPQIGAVVCGRYHIDGADLALTSSDVRLNVRFATPLSWLQPQGTGVAEPTLLLECDLVAFRVAQYERGVALVDAILILAPALAPPVKVAPTFTVDRAIAWSDFLATIRAFFARRSFVEVSTPTLVPSPGTEPFLEPFETQWEMGSERRTLFLPTSPEFHLKQMLVRGWPRIFELKSCFRNGEIGAHHQAEFTMLEWYRAFSNLDQIADDVELLLSEVGRASGISVPKLQRTTMQALFRDAFPGFTLNPHTSRDELARLATAMRIDIAVDDDFDDIFYRLFLSRIEPKLGESGPLLVRGYPPSQAALSRIGPDGFADRFEVYWRGLELANAFHELNDPDENEARFGDDAARKKSRGRPPVPRDENLVRAIRHGLPPSGGIALGADRLFMALFEIGSISDTRAFPIAAPE